MQNSNEKALPLHSFSTNRLFIRPFIQSDEVCYCQLYSDEKVMRNCGGALTIEQTKKHFANALKSIKQNKKTVINWAIIEKSSNQFIGFQALSWQKPTHSPKPTDVPLNQVEIGIVLTTIANGKQYPEEAMGALMEYAFNYQNIDRINAFYARKNLATQRFVTKLGFIVNDKFNAPNTDDVYQYYDKTMWEKNLIINIKEKETLK